MQSARHTYLTRAAQSHHYCAPTNSRHLCECSLCAKFPKGAAVLTRQHYTALVALSPRASDGRRLSTSGTSNTILSHVLLNSAWRHQPWLHPYANMPSNMATIQPDQSKDDARQHLSRRDNDTFSPPEADHHPSFRCMTPESR